MMPDWSAVLAPIALAISIVALALGLIVLARLGSMRRQIREIRQGLERHDTSLLALHGAMKTISEDVIHQGQAQSSVARTLERLVDQQGEMRLREVDEGLYPQAIRLIRSGHSREEVRRLCGLTEAETDLLFSLHGQGLAALSTSPGKPSP